jgi:hypothetical protein
MEESNGSHQSAPVTAPEIDNLLRRLWVRLPPTMRYNMSDTLLPETISERRIPGEEACFEIRLAWYRDIVGWIISKYFRLFVLIGTLVTILLLILPIFDPTIPFLYAMIPPLVIILIMILGVYEHFRYLQWRLMVTNARIIISIPQPQGWPLIDNIDLQGKPKVLDTNWSRNPVWRVFQFFTGARDLYISISALQFAEGTARVRDALVFPDVMPEDFFRFKAHVFKPGDC